MKLVSIFTMTFVFIILLNGCKTTSSSQGSMVKDASGDGWGSDASYLLNSAIMGKYEQGESYAFQDQGNYGVRLNDANWLICEERPATGDGEMGVAVQEPRCSLKKLQNTPSLTGWGKPVAEFLHAMMSQSLETSIVRRGTVSDTITTYSALVMSLNEKHDLKCFEQKVNPGSGVSIQIQEYQCGVFNKENTSSSENTSNTVETDGSNLLNFAIMDKLQEGESYAFQDQQGNYGVKLNNANLLICEESPATGDGEVGIAVQVHHCALKKLQNTPSLTGWGMPVADFLHGVMSNSLGTSTVTKGEVRLENKIYSALVISLNNKHDLKCFERRVNPGSGVSIQVQEYQCGVFNK